MSSIFNKRRITERVKNKFKTCLLLFAIWVCGSFISTAASANFTWDGDSYDHRKIYKFSRGYVEIYSNRDEVCTSEILISGIELLDYWFLAIVYFVALVYMFLGVAIISDIFMGAIEVITSQTRKIQYEDDEGVTKTLEVSVWNPTIANLTLMALGSSAPEILLSIIETVTTLGEEPGELGPSTIVGSAAFNLLVISGVSIIAVPTGSIKKVDDLGVFFTTALFSLLAYIWLYICLAVWSEDEITIPEAVITLAFFFLLVILAYIADKINAYRMKKKGGRDDPIDGGEPEEIGRLFNIKDFYHILDAAKAEEKERNKLNDTRKPEDMEEDKKESNNIQNIEREIEEHNSNENAVDSKKVELETYLKETFKVDDVKDIDPEEVKKAIEPRSVIGRMKYRRVIGNKLSGRKPFVVVKGMKKQIENELASSLKKSELNPYVGFKCLHYSVTEGAGHLEIMIYKKTQDALEIGVRTKDDTAMAPDDYHSVDEILVFEKEENEKVVKVEIVDDNEWEPDEDFLVELYDVNNQKRLDGKDTMTRVTIIDDDEPGHLGFYSAKMSCQSKNKVLKVKVVRKHGCDGIVKVKYQIKEADEKARSKAIPYEHFIPRTDILIFEHGETEKEIKIDIIEEENEDPDRDDVFQIRLFDVEPEGAKITKKDKCIIHIVGDNELDNKVEDIEKILDIMQKTNDVSWGQQFKRACLLHPQVDEEGNIDDVTGFEAFLHFTSIGWKVLFACVPPAKMWKGWFAFCVSLAFIGGVTYIIGELAALFGCVIGLKPAVTAITFVALGTSLPDTFASKQAAQESKNADSAIGNVTGSNSVNVFLGLGLPWVIAVIYYESQNDKYRVPAGSLSFSVALFLGVSTTCLLFLVLRRIVVGGELGGFNSWGRWLSFAF